MMTSDQTDQKQHNDDGKGEPTDSTARTSESFCKSRSPSSRQDRQGGSVRVAFLKVLGRFASESRSAF